MRKYYRICRICEMVPATHFNCAANFEPVCRDCFYLSRYDYLMNHEEHRPKISIVGTASSGSIIHDLFYEQCRKKDISTPMIVVEITQGIRDSFPNGRIDIDPVEFVGLNPGISNLEPYQALAIDSIGEPSNNHENDKKSVGLNHSHFTYDWRKNKRGRK